MCSCGIVASLACARLAEKSMAPSRPVNPPPVRDLRGNIFRDRFAGMAAPPGCSETTKRSADSSGAIGLLCRGRGQFAETFEALSPARLHPGKHLGREPMQTFGAG